MHRLNRRGLRPPSCHLQKLGSRPDHSASQWLRSFLFAELSKSGHRPSGFHYGHWRRSQLDGAHPRWGTCPARSASNSATPAATLARAVRRRVGRGLSGFVARSIAHELESEQLGSFLAYLEREHGQVSSALPQARKRCQRGCSTPKPPKFIASGDSPKLGKNADRQAPAGASDANARPSDAQDGPFGAGF